MLSTESFKKYCRNGRLAAFNKIESFHCVIKSLIDLVRALTPRPFNKPLCLDLQARAWVLTKEEPGWAAGCRGRRRHGQIQVSLWGSS